MTETLKVISPIDGRVYAERPLGTGADVDKALTRAVRAQKEWARVPLEERIAIAERAMQFFRKQRGPWGLEVTWQMGRPARYSPREVETAADRGEAMIQLAREALNDVTPAPKEGFTRYIAREPLGVVLVIPAWNFPFLIAVNTVVPALLAGNAVVLKHSETTPLVAERFAEAFKEAGLPDGLLEVLHLSHDVTADVIRDPRTAFVAFTGSVKGGHAMEQAAVERFVGVGLELGGKDPAYVRQDADLEYAIENLVDGSYFNSGQSCCGVERIYVHASLYDRFVEGFVELAKKYELGDPRHLTTTLGPMAKQSGADNVRAHIADAVAKGAKALIDPQHFFGSNSSAQPGDGVYVPPQVLVNVDHDMLVMREETFGPVVGIMSVRSDDEAVHMMNDSPYGLTASVWAADEEAVVGLGQRLDTGTVFMNRCDYLDPELAWVGVKDSGRGCTLSRVGYEQLTRPKSFHLRTKTR